MSAPFGLQAAKRLHGEVLFGTGHRMLACDPSWLEETVDRLLGFYKPVTVLCGVALGFDTVLANGCLKRGIPFVAVVPFEAQDKLWPKPQQEHYRMLLERAVDKVIISPHFNRKAFKDRNAWMVDHARHGITCWDLSSGGTAHCSHYAMLKQKHLTHINPVTRYVGPYRDGSQL